VISRPISKQCGTDRTTSQSNNRRGSCRYDITFVARSLTCHLFLFLSLLRGSSPGCPNRPTYAKNIGAGIRELRTQDGISQDRLAAALGAKRTHISAIERGIVIPSVAIIERVAAVFGMDIAEIVLALRGMSHEEGREKAAS
jgi:DNA-binding XRE family transcriptional regulator